MERHAFKLAHVHVLVIMYYININTWLKSFKS